MRNLLKTSRKTVESYLQQGLERKWLRGNDCAANMPIRLHLAGQHAYELARYP